MSLKLGLFSVMFTVLFGMTELNAQSWIMEETFGGDGDDRAYNLVAHANGNATHIGYTNSFGDPAFYPNVHIVQVDAVGTTIRELVYDARVAVSNNSNVYETEMSIFECANGDFVWTTGVVPTAGGPADILVVRTNAAGGVIWSTYLGANNDGDDFSTSIIETPSTGDILITGYTDAQPTAGNYDIVVARLNSAGTLLWGTTYGAADGDYGRCIRELTNGNFVVVGETISFGLHADGIQLSVDPGGALLWAHRHGTNGNPQGFATAVQSNNGDIYSTGVFWHSLSDADVWVVRTDQNTGAVIQGARYNGAVGGLEGGWFINTVPGALNNVVIAGVRPGTPSPSTDGFFLIVPSGLGAPVQYRSYGTSSNEETRCVAYTPGNPGVPFTQGGYWSLGWTNGSSSGSYDHYLLRSNLVGKTGCDLQQGISHNVVDDYEMVGLTPNDYSATSDADVIDRSVLSVNPLCFGRYVAPNAPKAGRSHLEFTAEPLVLDAKVYPQPLKVGVDASIEIQMERDAQLEIVLRDMQGRIVLHSTQTANVGHNILRLGLSQLQGGISSGTYILQINGSGQSHATQLMIID